MATYSLALKGAPAGYLPNQPTVLTVADSAASTAEPQVMRLNTPFLCQGPDGSQAWYTYDAERSIPGVRRVLKKV